MTFPPIDTGTASDTTPKPNQLAEISKAISKLPFPDLPDKALEITNGVTPNGMAFPSASTLPADYETALRAARIVTQVIEAMEVEASTEAEYNDSNASKVTDLRKPVMALLTATRLNALIVQSYENQTYLHRLQTRLRLHKCRRALLLIGRLKKKLNNAYMVSVTLKGDVALIKATRKTKRVEEELQKLAAETEARLEELDAQDQKLKNLLTRFKRMVNSMTDSNGPSCK